jgi:hypothetical protein
VDAIGLSVKPHSSWSGEYSVRPHYTEGSRYRCHPRDELDEAT